ncbi:MAG: acetyl-CoA carboxylase [Ectothiorhodospiraceae bacterium]|jgi:acetyl-CoA carboxylase biotin carboxyl carrier protein
MAEHTVEAHLPGVFYRRPSPDADPFVNEGDKVTADDTVGLIELMKSYHEIKAGAAGTIKSFLVDNEGDVDPGQGLVVIESD